MPDCRDSQRMQIFDLLNQVKDPCSIAARRAMGLVDMGLIEKVDITEEGVVDVFFRLTSPACYMASFLKNEAEALVLTCAGVTKANFHFDEGLDWTPDMIAPHHRARTPVRIKHPVPLEPTEP